MTVRGVVRGKMSSQAIIDYHAPFDRGLKELRHEDFAVLGQFCAKIITYCLLPYTKCSFKTKRKISSEFHQEELTITNFLVIFGDIASKLEK